MRGRAHKPEQCAGFMSVLINEKRISVFHLTTFRRQGCRRKRAQASRRGRIGSTYPKGFKSPSGQERAISSSAEKSRASPTKEKRPSRFSTSDLIRAISSSARLATSAEREVPRAEIASVSYKRKTLQTFFDFRLIRGKSEQCGEIASVSYHTARRKCRTVCPHKELQSAFIPFITSERMRYKNLRTDKRKTRLAFFAFRLKRANPSSVRSGYIRVFRTTAFCVVSTRHLCRAFNERGARSSSRRNRKPLLLI